MHNTNTSGLVPSSGSLPGNDKPTFEIADDEMEFGMGLHGEPGIERTKMMPCSDMVDRMYRELKEEMGLKEGDEIAVLVNGLGSTPLLELNLVFYELHKRMHKDGFKIYDTEIKTYCTCMEMGGFSITFLKLDDELKPYYDAPCYSPYYAKGSVSGETIEDDGEDEEIEFDENDVEPAAIVRIKDGELTELNAEDTRNMLLYVADKIIANKPYLTEIDSAIGDGDHGIGMAGGMQKAKKKLLKMAGEENAYQLFETAGQAMLMSMGGASGVIFGSLYLAGAKGMDPKSVITAKDLADMEKKSLDAIQERGGAQVGDKTMVDALSPAVDALVANADKGLLEMLKAAEEGAKQGVEDTKKYVAKFGRAKSLLERAIGHQDAGATSVYLIRRKVCIKWICIVLIRDRRNRHEYSVVKKIMWRDHMAAPQWEIGENDGEESKLGNPWMCSNCESKNYSGTFTGRKCESLCSCQQGKRKCGRISTNVLS